MGWGLLNIRKWEVAPLNKERAAKLSEEYDLPSSLGILLDIRGIHTREAIDGLWPVSGGLWKTLKKSRCTETMTPTA